MKLSFRCPKPECGARICTDVAAAQSLLLRCPACGAQRAPHGGDNWQTDGRVTRCPCCGCGELFTRRDFPQRLGLLVVIVAAAVSVIFILRKSPLGAMAALASVVVIDAVIAFFVGRVTVCYRCRAEFRGSRYNPDHEAFDLATAEKYPKM